MSTKSTIARNEIQYQFPNKGSYHVISLSVFILRFLLLKKKSMLLSSGTDQGNGHNATWDQFVKGINTTLKSETTAFDQLVNYTPSGKIRIIPEIVISKWRSWQPMTVAKVTNSSCQNDIYFFPTVRLLNKLRGPRSNELPKTLTNLPTLVAHFRWINFFFFSDSICWLYFQWAWSGCVRNESNYSHLFNSFFLHVIVSADTWHKFYSRVGRQLKSY